MATKNPMRQHRWAWLAGTLLLCISANLIVLAFAYSTTGATDLALPKQRAAAAESARVAVAPRAGSLQQGDSALSATVNTAALRVRSGPGTVYERIGVVFYGQELIVSGESMNCQWLEVTTPSGQGGWVSEPYVRHSWSCDALSNSGQTSPPPGDASGSSSAPADQPGSTQPTATVTANRLNVRSGPGTSFEIVGVVTHNQQLLVHGKTADCGWLQVTTPTGLQAWISGAYVTHTWPCSAIPDGGEDPGPLANPPDDNAGALAAADTPTATGIPIYLLRTPTPSDTPELVEANTLTWTPTATQPPPPPTDTPVPSGSGTPGLLPFEKCFSAANAPAYAAQVVNYYAVTQRCSVGPMAYYLVNGQAPAGAMPGEQCVAFAPSDLEARPELLAITDTSTNKVLFWQFESAQQVTNAYSIILHHGFTYACYIGAAENYNTYLRR